MIAKCYWNLHKKCWSVVDAKTRRVVNHLQELSLFNCTFKVSEAGRQRVLRDRRKNVHAYIVGRVSDAPGTLPGGRRVRYNPYETETFECEGLPIREAYCVMLHKDKSVTCLDPLFY